MTPRGKWTCTICDCEIASSTRFGHLRGRKHLEKAARQSDNCASNSISGLSSDQGENYQTIETTTSPVNPQNVDDPVASIFQTVPPGYDLKPGNLDSLRLIKSVPKSSPSPKVAAKGNVVLTCETAPSS